MKRYRKVWDLYKLTEVDDDAGGTTETESKVQSVNISLEPIQGSRGDQYSQIIDGKPFLIRMRFTNELNARAGDSAKISKDYYFKKGERELFIHDVLNVNEDSKYLELLAWEKA